MRYGKNENKKAWDGTGELLHKRIFGTVPRLPVPRLPPAGSLGSPKIVGNGATLHLGLIRLHVKIGGAVLIF